VCRGGWSWILNLDKKPKPRLAKVRSKAHAEAYLHAGWRLRTEFRAPGDSEPYEYLLEWPNESEPLRPDFPPKRD
jgi:hypothetical protein